MRHADSIAEALEQAIVMGELAEGERLDEVGLAERFCVSRTPIREALQRLAADGIVESLPRRGVFVRQPGPVELLEMFETMAELEAACGRLAAGRIGDAALAELAEANRLCGDALARGDADGYYRENERFHQLIYRAAGNAYLAEMAAKLQKRLRAFRRLQLRLRGRMAQSMAEHEAILAALSAGDGRAAARALRGHVAVQGEKFHRLLAGLKATG